MDIYVKTFRITSNDLLVEKVSLHGRTKIQTCSENYKKSATIQKNFSLTLILTFERMMNKLLGSLTTEKLLVISFVLTFIVVVAINEWLEAYGLALTLIATNKVSQRSASSTQLIIKEVKVIYLFALICLRFRFLSDHEIIAHQTSNSLT